MADANGRVVGDPYYDPNTETDPSQSAGNGFAYGSPYATNLEAQGGSVLSLASPSANPFTPVPGASGAQNPSTLTGGIGGAPAYTPGTSNGTDVQFLSYLLSQNKGNPQAAIDQFNQQKPNSALHPYYYPNQGKGVIGVQGQSLPYLVAPGTIDANQTDWQFGGVPGGDSGGSSGFRLDPSYLAPFTEKFLAPGDASNPASAFAALHPTAFSLPTEADLFSSPGFQGAQDAARNAVVNSNASKGLINSGGSIYDLANVTAGLEGQQYNDLVNQRANAYGINAGQAQSAFNNAWQQYLASRDIFQQNQTLPFNKLYSLATLGQSAAANAG